jgi:hypothetical protein
MPQRIAASREWEGYQYFGCLAEEPPNRRAVFRSLQAAMRARVANEVLLFRRAAWVQDAIQKLDEGAAAEPVLGRLREVLFFLSCPGDLVKCAKRSRTSKPA